MKVLQEYPKTERHDGHHYWREYEKEKYFCLNCGKQEVWAEQGEGDYYCGADLVCVACGHSWTMQGPSLKTDPIDLIVLEQLRTGITKEPTTRRGN